jgi:hypothetical protein
VYLGSYTGTTWQFGGKLDEVRIFGRALSAQEIVDLQADGQLTRHLRAYPRTGGFRG